ncbi:AIPR family protein [Nonomuraea sp. NPDC049649]|uniref:AIPR family protein n=1 Tax=Nonomuraea sp. NPDC049649 TaxID=3155776 RepID=UPI00343B1F5D
MEGETTEEFAITLEQVVEDRLGQHSGWLKRDAFVQVVADYLIEDGTLEDLLPCYHTAPFGKSRMEVAGYYISDDGLVLDLAVAEYGHSGQTLPRDQVLKRLRWAANFATACHDGYHLQMEESSPEFDMVQTIYAQWSEFSKVRIFFLTDARTTVVDLSEQIVGELPVAQHVWDITRLHKLDLSGRREEPINIDFGRLGGPLSCLAAPATGQEHRCFLTVIPGQFLADMYDQYGAKLLQRNVRAFLQARGKVNKGLNETIRVRPERFLAYNNGISITATGVSLDDRDGTALLRLEDVQIVNGGQTTASLHHAAKRDRADLTHIQVPAKITVVKPELLDELVPKISLYANSQNPINEADFQSNSPFHVELERLSRRLRAPATDGAQHDSHWYYERVRGQYQVDRARRSKAQQKAFDRDNPRAQKFTKTDAAKFEMTFEQAPHIVSLGAQKCFQRWTLDIIAERAAPAPDEQYFRDLVAKAIFYNQARKEIQRLNPGAGYLANVTAYTIARLTQEIDVEGTLRSIWRNQRLAPEMVRATAALSELVRGVLLSPPGSGNVTEWCKKEECWKRVQDILWAGA